MERDHSRASFPALVDSVSEITLHHICCSIDWAITKSGQLQYWTHLSVLKWRTADITLQEHGNELHISVIIFGKNDLRQYLP